MQAATAKVSMTFPIMQQCAVLILAGMMLDGGRDDVPALWLQQAGSAAEGKVNTLGAATGEDDLARFAGKHFSRPLARIVERGARLAADVMHAGRISPNRAQVGQQQHHGQAPRSPGTLR